MNELTIGTAGHIDHGKTALVKALTGTDTDRLPEEKQRGLTIDIGFAQLILPNGTRAGVVDLPGHAHYIKNMLAGAAGIDLVLLAVAADEGVMPQTREHLALLSLLGVRLGVIALTRCDLADVQQISRTRTEILQAAQGSFLADAPVVQTSAKTGQGLHQLVHLLQEQAERLPPRSAQHPFWMPIDRVFTLDGWGTIATGPVLDGALHVGEAVRLLPSGRTVRVRGLQSGGAAAHAVFAGQRAAVNLAGVKSEELSRGGVLAASASAAVFTRLDAKLAAHPSAPRPLTQGMRLHLSMGTASAVCRLCLLDREQLWPGESGLVQLRLERPIPARLDDRFVVQYFSPVEPAGGGQILALDPPKHRRLDSHVLERLYFYAQGTLLERLLYEAGQSPQTMQMLCARFWHLSEQTVAAACEALTQEGRLCVAEGWFLTFTLYAKMQADLTARLEKWEKQEPLADGMPQAQAGCPDFFLRSLAARRVISYGGGRISRYGKTAASGLEYQKMEQSLRAYCAPMGFCGIGHGQLMQALGLSEKKARQAEALFLQSGLLVRLPNGLLLLQERCQEAWGLAEQELEQAGRITLARMRDLLGSSRKPTQAILEWFDQMGLTVRIEDYRKLNNTEK